jgi:ATP-dependent Clp protease ATP-binding subunit ClpA
LLLSCSCLSLSVSLCPPFALSQYTGIAAKAVAKSVELAQTEGNIEVSPIHLAVVLFKDPQSLGVQLVNKAALSGQAISLEEVQRSLERAMRKLSRQDPPPNPLFLSTPRLCMHTAGTW